MKPKEASMQTIPGRHRVADATTVALAFTRSAGRSTSAALVGGGVFATVGEAVGLRVLFTAGSARVHIRKMSTYFCATTSLSKSGFRQFG
jgi:hypothetical protein